MTRSARGTKVTTSATCSTVGSATSTCCSKRCGNTVKRSTNAEYSSAATTTALHVGFAAKVATCSAAATTTGTDGAVV